MKDVDFDKDTITQQEIFAIGRTATGEGYIKVTSPDGSVDLDGKNELLINLTDKYRDPGTDTATGKIYGDFANAPFNVYVGPRHIPGNLFFTGENGFGFNAWIMYQQTFKINGIEFANAGGDFHGDLVLVPEAGPIPTCLDPDSGETITKTCLCTGSGAATSDRPCLGLNAAGEFCAGSDPDATGICTCVDGSSSCVSFDPGNGDVCVGRDLSSGGSCACKGNTSFVMADSCLGIDQSGNICAGSDAEGDGICSCDDNSEICIGLDPNGAACIGDGNGAAFGADPGDRCGICNGDGQSCCDTLDQKDELHEIDNMAKVQGRVLGRIAKIIRKIKPKRKNKKIAKAAIKDAKSDSLEQWVLTWKNPPISLHCDVVDSSCIDFDTSESVQKFVEFSEQKRDLRNSLKKIILSGGSKKQKRRFRRFNRRYNNLDKKISTMLNEVRPLNSVCVS